MDDRASAKRVLYVPGGKCIRGRQTTRWVDLLERGFYGMLRIRRREKAVHHCNYTHGVTKHQHRSLLK